MSSLIHHRQLRTQILISCPICITLHLHSKTQPHSFLALLFRQYYQLSHQTVPYHPFSQIGKNLLELFIIDFRFFSLTNTHTDTLLFIPNSKSLWKNLNSTRFKISPWDTLLLTSLQCENCPFIPSLRFLFFKGVSLVESWVGITRLHLKLDNQFIKFYNQSIH